MRSLLTTPFVLFATTAHAYDPGKAPRYPSPDMYRPNVDGIILRGSGSIGDASGLSIAPADGRARTLSDRANDEINVDDYILPGDASDAVGIQRAIAKATTLGRAVRLQARAYTVGQTIILSGRVTFSGRGWESILRAKSGLNVDVLRVQATSESQATGNLSNFRIDGNKANQTVAGNCLTIADPYDLVVRDVFAGYCKGDGVRVVKDTKPIAAQLNFYGLNSYRNDGLCFNVVGAVTDTHLHGGDLGYCTGGGAVLSTSSSINDTTIWGQGLDAVGVITGGPNGRISGARIEGWGREGLIVNAGNSNVSVSGTRFYANSFSAANTGLYSAVRVYGTVGAPTRGFSFIGNKVVSSLSMEQPYIHKAAIEFDASHIEASVLGNDLRFARGVDMAKIDNNLVLGLLDTDVTDYSWIKTRVLAARTTNLTLPAGAWTDVPLDSTAIDVEGEYNATSGVWTAKQSGRYRITGSLLLLPTIAGGSSLLRLVKNGTELRRIDARQLANTDLMQTGGTTTEVLVRGDQLRIQAFANNGGTIQAGAAWSYLQIGVSRD